MLFPTHLLVGYGIAARGEWSPYWVVLGAALPDLIDKPAALLGLMARYQSVGHSVVALLVVLGAGVAYRSAYPLAIGWASHLALDAVHMLLNGRPADVLGLVWPVIEHEPTLGLPPIAFAVQYVGTPSFYGEIAIWIAVAAALLANGEHRETET